VDINAINFSSVLNSWGKDLFSSELVSYIMKLPKNSLPLQKGISQGDVASEQPDKVALLACDEKEAEFVIKLAVFFTEIVSGCSCGDEPESLTGYCEMQLTINKQSGLGHFQVIG